MTFDNSKTIISLRIKFFTATILLLAYLTLAYVANMIRFPLLGIGDTIWTVILVGIRFLLTFTPMFLNYQFVFFSDDSEKIIFRYFSAGFISGQKKSLEIDKRSFSGYKLDIRFFGLIESVTLFQRFREGEAKYPPVYISALSKEEKARLIKSLNIYFPPA